MISVRSMHRYLMFVSQREIIYQLTVSKVNELKTLGRQCSLVMKGRYRIPAVGLPSQARADLEGPMLVGWGSRLSKKNAAMPVDSVSAHGWMQLACVAGRVSGGPGRTCARM